jgi:hypothetical protein
VTVQAAPRSVIRQVNNGWACWFHPRLALARLTKACLRRIVALD